jgi:hypothetical protein
VGALEWLGMPAKSSRPSRPQSPPIPETIRETQGLMEKLEDAAGMPCLAYWISSSGSICQNDVMAMAHLLKGLPRARTIGLFIKSDGGNPEAALRLVHLIRQYFQRLVLFAPFECASAATMVALGANEIRMGSTSYLTAVDTSLKHELSPVNQNNYRVSVSQNEVSRILRLWREAKGGGNPFPEIYKHLHPLVLGALDRSSSLSIRICEELLSYHLKDARKIRRISHQLNNAYPSHSYPITSREASRLGLKVTRLDADVERLLRDLNASYSHLAESVITDYDEQNYHNREVCNLIERRGKRIQYLIDKEWFYRKEERQWIPMNDRSCWQQVERKGRAWVSQKFHIR